MTLEVQLVWIMHGLSISEGRVSSHHKMPLQRQFEFDWGCSTLHPSRSLLFSVIAGHLQASHIYRSQWKSTQTTAARLLTVRTWECVCMSGLEGTREKENGKLAHTSHTCNRPLNTNNEVFVLLLSRWRRRYALLGVIQLLPWWTFRLHIPLRTCGHLCLSLLVFCTPEL